MGRMQRDLMQDLRIGVKIGYLFAAGFSSIAIVKYVLFGGEMFIRANGMGLLAILAVYAISGLTGGVLIGLLRPLRSTSIGSFCIGTVSSTPFCLCLAFMIFPRSEWYPPGVIMAMIVAILMGGGLGAVLYDQTQGWTD